MLKAIYGGSRDSFDDRYKEPEYHYGTEPNAFLVSQRHRLPAGGSALVPGDGEGRNGVWLAEQGLTVTTFDPSVYGVDKAKRLAHARGVGIDAHVAGVESWIWEDSRYDLIGFFFIHLAPDLRKRAHANAFAALKSGGIIILETFSPHQIEMRKAGAAGGPTDLERLFTCEMLREDFADATFLMLEETEADFAGHAHHGRCGVTRMVAQKPR